VFLSTNQTQNGAVFMEELLLAGIVIFCVMLLKVIFSNSQQELDDSHNDDSGLLSEEEKHEILDHLAQGNIAHHFETSLILKKNEKLIFSLPSVSYCEERVVRRKGVSQGISLRVARGIWLRTGGFQSASEEEIKELDIGELSITSKRLVFFGSSRSLEYQLGKINAVSGHGDTLAISRSGKSKVEYFVGVNSAICSLPDKRNKTDLESDRLNFRFQGEHLAEAIEKNVAGVI
jgi:hypothetical protein